MNKTQRGLGRGLDALFSGGSNGEEQPVIFNIPIERISPNKFQPRRVFDLEALTELSNSIMQYGILQPIVLRKIVNGYEIVAGERRWRASKQAGMHEIPAIVKEYTDSEMIEIALIENIQREDLNAIEEALAYRRLMDELSLTQEEVGRKVGRSRSLIANMVRLLNLDPNVQEHVSRGTLSIGQARPLLALETSELQIQAAEIIIEDDLSARGAEELVRRLCEIPKEVKEPLKTAEEKGIFVVEAEDRLKLILGTQVKIKPGKLKSKIEIEFYSPEDFDRILDILSGEPTTIKKKKKGVFVV